MSTIYGVFPLFCNQHLIKINVQPKICLPPDSSAQIIDGTIGTMTGKT